MFGNNPSGVIIATRTNSQSCSPGPALPKEHPIPLRPFQVSKGRAFTAPGQGGLAYYRLWCQTLLATKFFSGFHSVPPAVALEGCDFCSCLMDQVTPLLGTFWKLSIAGRIKPKLVTLANKLCMISALTAPSTAPPPSTSQTLDLSLGAQMHQEIPSHLRPLSCISSC